MSQTLKLIQSLKTLFRVHNKMYKSLIKVRLKTSLIMQLSECII